MKIISINAGSSSLKFKLYNMDEENKKFRERKQTLLNCGWDE